jgi:hypothetical protein
VEIGTEEFCDEIAAMLSAQERGETWRGRGRARRNWITYISSRGEMKISLREIT